MAQDYQEQIEQQGIQEYRSYIQEQMSQAREAADAELRSQHLANAPDGKVVDVVRRDINRPLDGRQLNAETTLFAVPAM